MRYLLLLLHLGLLSCATEEKSYAPNPVTFQAVEFVTLTNENTGGGSQIAYHLNGISEESLVFCFCLEECTREFVQVAALEFNEDTNSFRYKIKLGEDFQSGSTRDWCTRYK